MTDGIANKGKMNNYALYFAEAYSRVVAQQAHGH